MKLQHVRKQQNKHDRRRPLFEELERRVMLSADLDAPVLPPLQDDAQNSDALQVLSTPATASASVSETVRYTNNTGQNLSSIVMSVEPNQWPGCFLHQRRAAWVFGSSIPKSTSATQQIPPETPRLCELAVWPCL